MKSPISHETCFWVWRKFAIEKSFSYSCKTLNSQGWSRTKSQRIFLKEESLEFLLLLLHFSRQHNFVSDRRRTQISLRLYLPFFSCWLVEKFMVLGELICSGMIIGIRGLLNMFEGRPYFETSLKSKIIRRIQGVLYSNIFEKWSFYYDHGTVVLQKWISVLFQFKAYLLLTQFLPILYKKWSLTGNKKANARKKYKYKIKEYKEKKLLYHQNVWLSFLSAMIKLSIKATDKHSIWLLTTEAKFFFF